MEVVIILDPPLCCPRVANQVIERLVETKCSICKGLDLGTLDVLAGDHVLRWLAHLCQFVELVIVVTDFVDVL